MATMANMVLGREIVEALVALKVYTVTSTTTISSVNFPTDYSRLGPTIRIYCLCCSRLPEQKQNSVSVVRGERVINC